MNRFRKNAMSHQSWQARFAPAACKLCVRSFCTLLLAGLIVALSGCGGSSSSGVVAGDTPQVAGNWQFTMTTTSNSFVGSPLQGGFLLQKNGSLAGQITFSIVLPSTDGGSTTICNSGTANATGTVSGQTVSLTAVVGTLASDGITPATQTFMLSGGKLSSDNSTIVNGTYTLTAGFAVINSQTLPCGLASDAGTWSATLVPPITGGFQGFFHSTTSTTFLNQDFAVSGTLTQGQNIGASSATVTGTLLFQDPVTLLNDYPCLTTASVNGTISGDTVLLQIFSTNGTVVGQIGHTPGGGSGPSAVTLNKTSSGYVVQNVHGATSGSTGGGYAVTTKACSSGDSGNLCLALGSSKACNQPITLTPFSLTFAPQLLGSAATAQTVTLTNTSGAKLSGATLGIVNIVSGEFFGFFGDDFNGAPSFTEQDTCTQQGTINLDSGGSCTITVSFSPQQSCPWLPQTQTGEGPIFGLPPAKCPLTLGATLTVTIPSGGADADNEFAVPVTGTGLSFVVPSVPELDFGAQALGEASPPQTITFTNQSPGVVSILPSEAPCTFPTGFVPLPFPRPPLSLSGQAQVSGLQLAQTVQTGSTTIIPITAYASISPPLVNAPTVQYNCDIDPPVSKGGSGRPNFEILADECSGQSLQPFGRAGDSCTIQIEFVPQPGTWGPLHLGSTSGLDDFLQLNTAWCGDNVPNNLNYPVNPPEANCEIDSGRFPVEIKTNPPSPLRMLPGAGMDFGFVTKGTAGGPLTITLFNDPEDPNSATVNITSKIISGDYLETDTCGIGLAPGDSCSITITFIPKVVGLDPSTFVLTYNTGSLVGLIQTIYMRGTGQ